MKNNTITSTRTRLASGILVASAFFAASCSTTADDTGTTDGTSATVAVDDTSPETTVTPDSDTTTPDSDTTVADTAADTTAAVVVAAAPDASAYVLSFGDVTALAFSDGEPGSVNVVANTSSVADDGTVAVVVRNNTNNNVGSINVAGTARNADGTLAGSGSDQGLKPLVVAPGEIAFGYVYFDSSMAGNTYDFTFDVTGNDVDDYFLPVTVVEINNTGDQIVGIAANNLDVEVTGPVRVDVLCFDTAGALLGNAGAYLEQDTLAAGATGSFSVDLYGDVCPVGLVAAGGYGN